MTPNRNPALYAFRCSTCNAMNIDHDPRTTVCRDCRARPAPVIDSSASILECNICYDEKPSPEFDVSRINSQIICECFKNEKYICLSCAGRISKCPFCRRIGFLRRIHTTQQPTNNELVFNPTPFDAMATGYTGTSFEEYRLAVRRYRINQCLDFNARLFERIYAIPEDQRTPQQDAYILIVEEVINNIEHPIQPSNFSIVEAGRFVETEDSIPFDFLTNNNENIPQSYTIYIRDLNDDEEISVYRYTLYNDEELIDRIDDQLRYNIAYHLPERLRPFITDDGLRISLTTNNPIWDTIRENELNEFVIALIDGDRYISSLIQQGDYIDVLDLNDYGYCEVESINFPRSSGYEDLTGIIHLTDDGTELN